MDIPGYFITPFSGRVYELYMRQTHTLPSLAACCAGIHASGLVLSLSELPCSHQFHAIMLTRYNVNNEMTKLHSDTIAG